MYSGLRRKKAMFFYAESGERAQEIYKKLNERFEGVFFHLDEKQAKVGFTCVYDNQANKKIKGIIEGMGACEIP